MLHSYANPLYVEQTLFDLNQKLQTWTRLWRVSTSSPQLSSLCVVWPMQAFSPYFVLLGVTFSQLFCHADQHFATFAVQLNLRHNICAHRCIQVRPYFWCTQSPVKKTCDFDVLVLNGRSKLRWSSPWSVVLTSSFTEPFNSYDYSIHRHIQSFRNFPELWPSLCEVTTDCLFSFVRLAFLPIFYRLCQELLHLKQ